MKKNHWLFRFLFLFLCVNVLLPAEAQNREEFKTFLKKFTNSAAFQYSRIKFPLKTPITLSIGDDDSYKTFPFTKKEWPLLMEDVFEEERTVIDGEGTYCSKFTVNEPTQVVFEAGYEESDLDLRVCFELVNGKWFLTDCYTSWYNFSVRAAELPKVIQEVQNENKDFIKRRP